jgi:hypothetical protein
VSFPTPASFKEADTGRYIVNNVENANQFGVSNPNDLIGLTIYDLTSFVPAKFGAQHADWVAKLDFDVREKLTVGRKLHSFLSPNGDIQYQETIKFPVLGNRRNVLGIVSYSQTRTESLPNAKLYCLYQEYYGRKEAVMRTLTSLGVSSSFHIPPTDTQFRVFLAKAERYANKDIARLLGMSPRTVECHLDALRNKVLDGDLRRVFARIKRGAPCVDR